MRYTVQFIANWSVVDGANEVTVPFLRSGDSIMDVTGQPCEHISPDPNLTVWEAWCDEATLNDFENSADFHVLWFEEIIDESP